MMLYCQLGDLRIWSILFDSRALSIEMFFCVRHSNGDIISFRRRYDLGVKAPKKIRCMTI
jgi:hypothetical protein